MATIPYSPVFNNAPNSGGTSGVSVNTPDDAFGGGVAKGLKHLGAGIGDAGSELWKAATELQDLQNRTEADKADTEYMTSVAKMRAEFNALQGGDPAKNLEAHIKAMTDARDSIRNRMSNPAAARMFDSASRRTLAYNINNAAGYAAGQAKAESIAAKSARIEATIGAAATAPTEAEFTAHANTAHAVNKIKMAEQGLSPEHQQSEDLKVNSSLYRNRTIYMAQSERDPTKAKDFLEKAKAEGLIAGPDYDAALKVVTGQMRVVESKNIANEVFPDQDSNVEEKPVDLKVLQDQAKAKAREKDPNDPVLEQQAVAAVTAKFNNDRNIRKSFRWDNNQVIANTILKGVKDLDDLLNSSPEARTAYYNLPEADRLRVPGQINSYNAARDKVGNEATYNRLRGMARSEEGREEFMNTNVFDQRLSQSQMELLAALQDRLRKNPGQDMRVVKAMNWLRDSMPAELQALGIYKRNSAQPDSYDAFSGALQDAIDTYRESTGKPPTREDVIQKIAPMLLKKQYSDTTLFGTRIWSTRQPAFQANAPAEFSERVRADITARGGEEPTAAQINRAWVRTQMIKLYPPKAKKGSSDGK